MADHTHIEWTDATWNPVTGCSVISPGCANCYAMRLAGGRLQHHPSRAGLTAPSKAGPVWNGRVRFNMEWLRQPLSWTRPRRIFVCAHGDLFHEAVPDAWIDQVFAVMALAPQHTFQVLTKRSARMRAYLSELVEKPTWTDFAVRVRSLEAALGAMPVPAAWPKYPFSNVWLGVSAEDQARADERVPDLLATPAALRFLSAEPLLGPIDLTRTGRNRLGLQGDALRWPGMSGPSRSFGPRLDWVIAGGESGIGARAMHPAWARQLRDACDAAGVAFFFKQWGEYRPVRYDEHDRRDAEPVVSIAINGALDREKPFTLPPTGGVRPCWCQMARTGKRAAGRLLDGREHNAMPAPVQ